MDRLYFPDIHDKWVRSYRGNKNPVDPDRPYAWNTEKERTPAGHIEDTATIFITNRECPFSCLMCDLWKNTLDKSVSQGTIPRQIEWALNQMPPAKHIKLYNSGNFFDPKAIPKADYESISRLLSNFETVIVESHPKMINEATLHFRDLLMPKLQVAIGLETSHPEVFPLLNKKMELSDFERSVRFLNENDILSRAFILLRPPFMTEKDGIIWGKRSIEFAFGCGVECCVIIPTRPGNGALDHLMDLGQFSPPDIRSLEHVLDYGIGLNKGRVFADLWDIERFSTCPNCLSERVDRLNRTNLAQQILPEIECSCTI